MLPEQVRKQVEQANEIAARLSLVPASEVEDAVVVESETPAETPQEPVVASTTVSEPVQTELDLEPPHDEWETKYKVLQGKYNAEVPRLQTQLREMQTHIDRMQGAMAVLQSAPQAKPEVSEQSDTAKAFSNVKPEEVEEYGAEFIDMIERAALQRVAPQIEALQNTIKNMAGQLNGQVQQVAQKQMLTDEQKFFAKVGEAVPDWQEINTNPEWLEYLGEVDPMSGIIRQVLLNDARRNLDVGRVVNIFKSFTGNTTVSEVPTQPAQTRSEALAKQVQPGRSKATPVQSGQAIASVSQNDIVKLYDDYRKGLYKGRESEFKSKEIAMLDAINAGKYAKR